MSVNVVHCENSPCARHFSNKMSRKKSQHLFNNAWKTQAAIAHRLDYRPGRDGISIMDNVNIGVCAELSRKMFFSSKPMRWQAAVLRFQRRDWISLYGLSFNLAALVRLYRHAVRYFHPPARFLNGETATRTFHIWDFCRDGSRGSSEISCLRDIQSLVYLPSSLSNIAISIKISAIPSRAGNFFAIIFHSEKPANVTHRKV